MRKRHTAAFKAQVVQAALKEEKTIAQIASEHDIHPNQISTWKAAALKGLPSLFEKTEANQRAKFYKLTAAGKKAVGSRTGTLATVGGGHRRCA